MLFNKLAFTCLGAMIGALLAVAVVYSMAWFLDNYVLLASCQAG